MEKLTVIAKKAFGSIKRVLDKPMDFTIGDQIIQCAAYGIMVYMAGNIGSRLGYEAGLVDGIAWAKWKDMPPGKPMV